MIKNSKLIILIISILVLFSNCDTNKFQNTSDLLLTEASIDASSYYVILITDVDCSECNSKFIQHWLNSIKISSNECEIAVYILMYSYSKDKSKFDLENDFSLLGLEGDYTVTYTDNFDLIKNIYIDANKPDGPFALKIIDKKVIYIRGIREPFL